MNVLIVEDERRLLAFLKSALEAEGYQTSHAGTAAELRDAIAHSALPPDLILMDRMLYGEDATALIPLARRAFPNARVLVLSAISTHDEKAAVLDLGADDYLGKPFSLVELSARVRALMRRGTNSVPNGPIHVKNLSLDPIKRTVSVSGKRLDLSNKEFQVLSLLLRVPGRVLSKYQLLDQVWDVQNDVESNVVEVTIRNLRSKLADVKSEVIIENRRNVGYWIEN